MNGNGITDFHSHILPGADHGSKNRETTKRQLEILKSIGVERVVATPHFYPQIDSVESFLEKRAAAVERLQSIYDAKMPTVFPGAEVLVCPGIDHMQHLDKLCIPGTDVILLEMPMSGWSAEIIETVRRISASGLVAVMAHIDRYKKTEIAKLSLECDRLLYQLNGSAVSGFLGKKRVNELCSALPVACVGSDIHGADKKAAAELKSIWQHIEKKGINLSECASTLLERALKL